MDRSDGISLSSGLSRAQVALTSHDNYNRTMIRQKVQPLSDSIGGISDAAGPGDTVAIIINLTGGACWAGNLASRGIDIRKCKWTHPEVVRAAGELRIDSGVSPDPIHISFQTGAVFPESV